MQECSGVAPVFNKNSGLKGRSHNVSAYLRESGDSVGVVNSTYTAEVLS